MNRWSGYHQYIQSRLNWFYFPHFALKLIFLVSINIVKFQKSFLIILVIDEYLFHFICFVEANVFQKIKLEQSFFINKWKTVLCTKHLIVHVQFRKNCIQAARQEFDESSSLFWWRIYFSMWTLKQRRWTVKRMGCTMIGVLYIYTTKVLR